MEMMGDKETHMQMRELMHFLEHEGMIATEVLEGTSTPKKRPSKPSEGA